GRNDPCPCGSGLKYKKCCLGKPDAAMKGSPPEEPCPECGRVHGQCLICCTTHLVDSKEDAILSGYMAALGARVKKPGATPFELAAFMRDTLCEIHRPVWDDVELRSAAHMRGGQA